jgi:gamma-glutamylaminecyclotransferase
MMLDRPGEGLRVRGGLFDIDEDRLQVLDELEGVDNKFSFRGFARVAPVGGGIPSKAIGYLKSEKWLDPLHSGYLADHQDRRFVKR